MADALTTGDVTIDAGIRRRADSLFAENQNRVYRSTDKLFSRLLVLQWLAAIAVALFVSPTAWHLTEYGGISYVVMAVVLGGVLTACPFALAHFRPGEAATRHVIAVAQMLYGALFIHLTGGRIETHFHVFGSLAVLSFYRDWRVLVSATMVVVVDHLVRGLIMPQSVYGIATVQPWRWVEHMCWVFFEDAFLLRSCLGQVAEMREVGLNQARIEETQSGIEELVDRRTAELQASERRFSEQYAEKEQLAEIVASANDSIIAETPEGRIISWNKGAERCFGYTADEVMYQSISLLVPDDKKEELDEFIAAGRRGETLESIETTRVRKDGTIVSVLVMRSPMFDAARQVIGISEMIHDITERKEAEKRVSEFYSMVSHELRTPLTSIRGALGLIESGIVEPDESADLVQVARGSADRLIRLINDMLDLKKIESGKMELHRTKFDAEELVTQVIYAIRGMANEERVSLLHETKFTDLVYADWDKSTQVLTNLVSNAIKFSPQGEVKIVIDQGDYHRVRFSVIDEGPGIATADMHKLFGKFQQLDSSDSRQKGGTGLGLAICKALVERHGGAIGVDSVVGNGSTFWFELPMYIDKPLRSKPAKSEGDETAATILLVEDDRELSEVFSKLLSVHDFTPVACRSLAEARKALETVCPELIILDLKLPDGNGLDFIEDLRLREDLIDVPVVVVTGFTDQQKASGSATIVDWLCKPCDEQVLMHAVQRALELAHRCKVLVVDDDESTRRVVTAQLKAMGLACVEARDGSEAINLTQSESPDLIVLDVMLPDMDGFRVVERLNGGDAGTTPLLVYTCRDLSVSEREQLTLGVTRHLTKGDSSETDMKQAVGELLGSLWAAAKRRENDGETNSVSGLLGRMKDQTETGNSIEEPVSGQTG